MWSLAVFSSARRAVIAFSLTYQLGPAFFELCFQHFLVDCNQICWENIMPEGKHVYCLQRHYESLQALSWTFSVQ